MPPVTNESHQQQYYHYKCGIPLGLSSTWSLPWPYHDDVITWRHVPRWWPFMRGIHWSTVGFSHKGQWRGALVFSLICAGTNGWANTRDPGDLRRHLAYYDATVTTVVIVQTLSFTERKKHTLVQHWKVKFRVRQMKNYQVIIMRA